MHQLNQAALSNEPIVHPHLGPNQQPTGIMANTLNVHRDSSRHIAIIKKGICELSIQPLEASRIHLNTEISRTNQGIRLNLYRNDGASISLDSV